MKHMERKEAFSTREWGWWVWKTGVKYSRLFEGWVGGRGERQRWVGGKKGLKQDQENKLDEKLRMRMMGGMTGFKDGRAGCIRIQGGRMFPEEGWVCLKGFLGGMWMINWSNVEGLKSGNRRMRRRKGGHKKMKKLNMEWEGQIWWEGIKKEEEDEWDDRGAFT